MVKGGGSDVAFQRPDPWDSPDICAQQVPAEHIAVNPQDLESITEGYVIVSRRFSKLHVGFAYRFLQYLLANIRCLI